MTSTSSGFRPQRRGSAAAASARCDRRDESGDGPVDPDREGDDLATGRRDDRWRRLDIDLPGG
ncbi:hypothetical protein ABFT23_06670 [Nocardioides sp. C4-1]|uniref:hypothetical protein n=1 Tax=Nocardioides sp. C4-1 TaxID=3151851 RepID=UPI0032646A58